MQALLLITNLFVNWKRPGIQSEILILQFLRSPPTVSFTFPGIPTVSILAAPENRSVGIFDQLAKQFNYNIQN